MSLFQTLNRLTPGTLVFGQSDTSVASDTLAITLLVPATVGGAVAGQVIRAAVGTDLLTASLLVAAGTYGIVSTTFNVGQSKGRLALIAGGSSYLVGTML